MSEPLPVSEWVVVITGDGVMLIYRGQPGPGRLVASRTQAGQPGGMDPYGNCYPQGIFSTL